MPKNPQNTINQTALKHYKQLRSVVNESLIWLQITRDTEKKLKVETESKEGDKKILEVITMEIIKF